MLVRRQINGNTLVEITRDKNTTLVSVINDSKHVLPSISINIDANVDAIELSGYIVIYTKQGKYSNILSVFDTRTNKVLDINKDINTINEIEDYLNEEIFPLATILTLLNYDTLNYASLDSIEKFISYLTDNTDLPLKEVINHIIDSYPILNNFRDLNKDNFADKYNELVKVIGTTKLSFKKIRKINNGKSNKRR